MLESKRPSVGIPGLDKMYMRCILHQVSHNGCSMNGKRHRGREPTLSSLNDTNKILRHQHLDTKESMLKIPTKHPYPIMNRLSWVVTVLWFYRICSNNDQHWQMKLQDTIMILISWQDMHHSWKFRENKFNRINRNNNNNNRVHAANRQMLRMGQQRTKCSS